MSVLAAFWLLKAAEQEPHHLLLVELTLRLWSGEQVVADAIFQSAEFYKDGLPTQPEALVEIRRVMRKHTNDK
jgi:hypothetical protein